MPLFSGIGATGEAAAFCDGEIRILQTVSGRTGDGNL